MVGAEVFYHPLRLAHCRGDRGERTLMKGTWTFAPNSQSERGDHLQRVAQLRIIRYPCLLTLRYHCLLTSVPRYFVLPSGTHGSLVRYHIYLPSGTWFGYSDIPVWLPSDTILFTLRYPVYLLSGTLFVYAKISRFTLR